MALVTSTEMFKKAYAGGYAIGAFNVNNMEIVQGITEACGELKAPVILQVSKGARVFVGRIRSISSKPSAPGSMISRRIRSKLICSRRSAAARPSYSQVHS